MVTLFGWWKNDNRSDTHFLHQKRALRKWHPAGGVMRQSEREREREKSWIFISPSIRKVAYVAHSRFLFAFCGVD